MIFLRQAYQGLLTHQPIGRETGPLKINAVCRGCTERLFGSDETINLDSISVLLSRNGTTTRIGDGEGLSEVFGS